MLESAVIAYLVLKECRETRCERSLSEHASLTTGSVTLSYSMTLTAVVMKQIKPIYSKKATGIALLQDAPLNQLSTDMLSPQQAA